MTSEIPWRDVDARHWRGYLFRSEAFPSANQTHSPWLEAWDYFILLQNTRAPGAGDWRLLGLSVLTYLDTARELPAASEFLARVQEVFIALWITVSLKYTQFRTNTRRTRRDPPRRIGFRLAASCVYEINSCVIGFCLKISTRHIRLLWPVYWGVSPDHWHIGKQ